MKTPSALAVLAGALTLVFAAPVAAKILQAVTEDIAQARVVEAAGNKGGAESNKLRNTSADAAPVANAAATARTDAQTVLRKLARGGNVRFEHWINQQGERSELAMDRTEIGGTYWYGWSMQLPESFEHAGHKTIVMQLAMWPKKEGRVLPCRAIGPFMHITAEGKLVFHLQHAGDDVDTKCDEFEIIADVSKLKGKWLDFVMHAKWTGDKDGFLKFWVKEHDNHYAQKIGYVGRTWWNDEGHGPYFKMGAYTGDPQWGGPESITLYTDEFRLGDADSSFDEVAPPGREARATEAGKGHVRYVLYRSALNRQEIPIMVYTPPGYDPHGTKRYPVVYNLHGAGGGSPARQWDRVHQTLTRAMDAATVEPVIYVFVNGLGSTGFVDMKPPGTQIQSSIVQELIPFIDGNYRTIASRAGRAIDGFSMGGGGALMVAFKNSTLFSCVVGYGSAVRDGSNPDPSRFTGPNARFADMAHFREFSPWHLAEANADAIRTHLKIRMVCGDADSLYPANIALKDRLAALNIPVDWVPVPGVAHDTKGLFNRVGVESLKFMHAQFRQP